MGSRTNDISARFAKNYQLENRLKMLASLVAPNRNSSNEYKPNGGYMGANDQWPILQHD